MRCSLRRRRKIQRSARSIRLAAVNPSAASTQAQNAGGTGRSRVRTSMNTTTLKTTPVRRMAAADVSNSTSAIARGACVGRRPGSGNVGAGRALTNFADRVGRLVLRLVIRARLQLGEEAKRDELHAGDD